jgi:hypothetical protein
MASIGVELEEDENEKRRRQRKSRSTDKGWVGACNVLAAGTESLLCHRRDRETRQEGRAAQYNELRREI